MGKKRAREPDIGLDSWAANLARQVQDASGAARSKADRIEKRNEKKQRRRDETMTAGTGAKTITKPAAASLTKTGRQSPSMDSTSRRSTLTASRLAQLSEWILERVALVKQECISNAKRPKPYTPVPMVAKKRRKQRDDGYQPRSCDYGGIGLARESLKISFDDPSWQPKLEQEFAEHIVGFYGKQRTKAMKKQLDGTMLWRRLLADKQKPGSASATSKKAPPASINGKKLSAMTPDERVEAMIKAGLL